MAKPQQDEFDTANVMGSYSVGEWAEAPENPENQAAAGPVEADVAPPEVPAAVSEGEERAELARLQAKYGSESVKVTYPDPPGSQE